MSVKISIIIPVYNTGELLRGCLDSILQQTLPEWELILIDDGSRDQSGQICDEYAARDHRIRVIHKENEGVSTARNVGLSIAQGEYVGFVDSDDTIVPEMYEQMYYEAKQNDAEIAMCDAVTVFSDCHEEPDTIRQLDQSCTLEKSDWSPSLLKEMAGSSWRCIYSYALIQRHSSRFSVALKFSEDRVFNIYMMGYANRVTYIKEAYYNRLIWEGSTVHRFHADYFEAAKLAAAATEEALMKAWNNDTAYQAAYIEQFVSASIAAINNYFYRTCPWSLSKKVQEVRKLCDDKMIQKVLMHNMCGGIRGKLILRKNVFILSVFAVYSNIKHGR